jgi:23S rRNA (guanosine2251-2'-O)-methyltransferase
MFRTADAAGVSKVILSGYTPGPLDPRGKPRKEFVKVSLGAERYVPSERAARLAAALRKLKKEGYTVVGVEQHPRAVSLFDWCSPSSRRRLDDGKIAVVMGNEVRGLSPQAIKLCDALVEIPMRGKKESLNVSVAAGIVLYALRL